MAEPPARRSDTATPMAGHRPGSILVPAVSAAVMFAILIGLGVWQLHRLVWKRAILAAIDQAERAPPVPLPDHPARFEKVVVTGQFQPGRTLFYGADVRDTPQGPALGGQLIQVLRRSSAPPLLVDRGWCPDRPERCPIAPSGQTTVQGYIRQPERPGPFTPANDLPGGRFYTLDPVSMAAALKIGGAVPYVLVMLGPPTGLPPVPATALPRPPNDHLNYAITWFSLAIVLAGIFIAYARRARRSDE